MLLSIHDWFSLFAALLCFLGIVHPRLPTGILGTIGLGACLIGILYGLDDFHDPELALDIVIGGLVMIGICLAWRLIRRPNKGMMRRVEDWTPRWEVDTLSPELRDAVRGGSKESPPV